MENTRTSGPVVWQLPNGVEPAPGVVTGGQPNPAGLKGAAEAGVRVVVDTRSPLESRGFDEAETVRALGMEYVNIPVEAMLEDEMIDRLRLVLREAEGEVMIHCASGNRVGGLLIPHLVLDLGMDPNEAVEKAIEVGLRSPTLAQQAMDYIGRNRS